MKKGEPVGAVDFRENCMVVRWTTDTLGGKA
jgi:hypothetical protein